MKPLSAHLRAAGLLGALLSLAASASATSPGPDTSRPINDGPGVFRFAILPDRNGGNRPGVFESAITKLNLLQPEFVLTTGDLIDGYTTDPQVLAAQWDEFDALVNRLQMPFHYVPGNHDISNPAMLEAWRQRFGPPWSAFVHADVLFLCLHTEDRPFGGLGAEQIAWVKQTLADHPAVRWTLVFMHRPLWREQNQAGFEQVRTALRGRKFTVFAAHYHNFLKSSVDGMDAYVLATAGGSSQLRGAEFGELDHVTWVTMKPDGPVVANLRLDGILPDDLVTEITHDRVAALRDGSWLRVPPVLHSGPTFESLSVPLEFHNATDGVLQVHGTLTAAPGLAFAPRQIDRRIAPHQDLTLPVELVALGAPASLDAVNESHLTITLDGSYEVAGQTLSLPASGTIRLDWPHAVPVASSPIQVDGDLADWSGATFAEIEHPMFIQEDWDWHGPEDGRFRFAVRARDDRIFVAVETTDDRVITSSNHDELQDHLQLVVRTSTGTTQFEGWAGTKTAERAVRTTPTGLVGEFSFARPAGEKSFHLNVGWVDVDRADNTKPSVLWWRDPAVTGFGEFRLSP